MERIIESGDATEESETDKSTTHSSLTVVGTLSNKFYKIEKLS